MTLNSFKWLYASIDWVMVMMMIKTIVWMRKIGMMVRYKQRWWWVFQGVVWRQEVLWVAFWRHHFLTGITNFGFPGSDRSSLCHRAKTQRRQDKKKKYKKDAKTKRQKKESLIWQICTLAMCGSIPPPIMFLLSTLMVKFVSFYCDIDTGAEMLALIQLWSIIQIMAINRRDILSILYFREDSRKRPERKRPLSIDVFPQGRVQ